MLRAPLFSCLQESVRGGVIARRSRSIISSSANHSRIVAPVPATATRDRRPRLFSEVTTTSTPSAASGSTNNPTNGAHPPSRTTTQQQLNGTTLNGTAQPPPSPPPPSRFAVVRHGDAYRKAIDGLHGQQLQLAQLEGEGKDDPDWDPFLEEELEELRQQREEEKQQYGDEDELTDDDEEEEEEEEEDDDDDDEEEEYDDDHGDDPNAQRMDRKKYNNDGSLKRNKSEIAILRAGAPAGGKVAVIALHSTQYKVTTDDLVIVNRMTPVQKYCVGSIHTIQDDDVLLVSTNALTLVGMPSIPGAQVDIMVEEITRDKKVVVFKRRRRKNSRRKKGHRRNLTFLRILDIRLPPEYEDHEFTPRPEPAPLILHPDPRRMI